MAKIETEITINASVAAVWDILMNFNNYPNWNPFIQSIKGEAKVGSRLENTICLKPNQAQVFKPIIQVVNAQQEFRWLGSLWLKGLFDGEHYFKLEKLPNNQTRLIHGERFSGILSGLIMAMIRTDTQRGFEKMNQALKKEVE